MSRDAAGQVGGDLVPVGRTDEGEAGESKRMGIIGQRHFKNLWRHDPCLDT